VRSVLALTLGLALAASGCAVFDGPPEVSIEGLQQGLLADPTASIVLAFSKTPVTSTLKLEMVEAGGKLPPFYTYSAAAGDVGGVSAFSVDDAMRTIMTIEPDVAPAIGPSLQLVIAPGLSDLAGTVTHAERRLVFGYAPSLTCTKPVSVLQTGTYFFLANVTLPIHVQVQLFGVIDVDPLTGAVHSRFTKARRNPDPNRCPTPCDATQVCRLLPTPQCVVASTPADSVDEFSDYVPNPDPPTGFSFFVQGCATDQGGSSSAFATEKVDVQVTQPMVKLQQTQLNAAFTPDGAGVLRGTGSLVAETVLLGPIDSGKGSGDLTARSLTDAEAPPGIPGP
jgi:hypothetical protein